MRSHAKYFPEAVNNTVYKQYVPLLKYLIFKLISTHRKHDFADYSTRFSTDQKPNRECLTERVLFPFHTRPHSCSVSVLYPFCICSVSVLYLFYIRSVSVPFPFCICSVLFCSHSVSVPSVSVLGTWWEERGFRELIYKISATHLHFIKWVKTVAFMREYGQETYILVKIWVQLLEKYGKMVL